MYGTGNLPNVTYGQLMGQDIGRPRMQRIDSGAFQHCESLRYSIRASDDGRSP